MKPHRYMSVIDRIMVRVLKNPATGCWEWQSTTNKDGYGVMIVNRKKRGVHRVMYELSYPDHSTDGLFVCHHCDNPSCVNPDHLFVGTHQDNENDKTRKGRRPKTPVLLGSSNRSAKLDESKVREIRRRLAAGEAGYALAKQYGVSKDTIYGIKHGRLWRHLP